MHYTLRWFGPHDPVTLDKIAQVPGLDGVVTSLTDVPAGEPWTQAGVERRVADLAAYGLKWTVVESIPVSEEIKTGGPLRDRHVEAWARTLRLAAEAGVRTVCYNFMPVFDWMRSDLALRLEDGSTVMAYDHAAMTALDLSRGFEARAAWASGYDADGLRAAMARYESLGADGLRRHLAAFLADVVPVAEEVGVRLAIHPDDPPWTLFGLPRIVKDADDLRWIVSAVRSPANGMTLCTGSLGASRANDLVAMASEFADDVAFVHARNVKHTGERDFHEVAHHVAAGDVDIPAVMWRLLEAGVDVPIRPDHGRMIWGEEAIPGYGLHDRAIGLAYLQGLEHAHRLSRRP